MTLEAEEIRLQEGESVDIPMGAATELPMRGSGRCRIYRSSARGVFW